MNKNGYVAGVLVLFYISVILASIFVMPLWTERSMEFWLTKHKGRQVDVPYWLAFVTNIAGNGLTPVFNVGTEVYRRTE